MDRPFGVSDESISRRMDASMLGYEYRNRDVDDLDKEIAFNSDQIAAIKKTFDKYAFKWNEMDQSRFRLSLGILAMDNGNFLSERIFKLIDADCDGIIQFMDFLKYLNVVMNGKPCERARMSFRFIDHMNKGYIEYEDIHVLIEKVALLWKDLTGKTVIPQKEHIDQIFRTLDYRNTGKVFVTDFYRSYYQSESYFQWFELFNPDEFTEKRAVKFENESIENQSEIILRMDIENAMKSIQLELEDLILSVTKISHQSSQLLKQQQDNKERKKLRQKLLNPHQNILRQPKFVTQDQKSPAKINQFVINDVNSHSTLKQQDKVIQNNNTNTNPSVGISTSKGVSPQQDNQSKKSSLIVKPNSIQQFDHSMYNEFNNFFNSPDKKRDNINFQASDFPKRKVQLKIFDTMPNKSISNTTSFNSNSTKQKHDQINNISKHIYDLKSLQELQISPLHESYLLNSSNQLENKNSSTLNDISAISQDNVNSQKITNEINSTKKSSSSSQKFSFLTKFCNDNSEKISNDLNEMNNMTSSQQNFVSLTKSNDNSQKISNEWNEMKSSKKSSSSKQIFVSLTKSSSDNSQKISNDLNGMNSSKKGSSSKQIFVSLTKSRSDNSQKISNDLNGINSSKKSSSSKHIFMSLTKSSSDNSQNISNDLNGMNSSKSSSSQQNFVSLTKISNYNSQKISNDLNGMNGPPNPFDSSTKKISSLAKTSQNSQKIFNDLNGMNGNPFDLSTKKSLSSSQNLESLTNIQMTSQDNESSQKISNDLNGMNGPQNPFDSSTKKSLSSQQNFESLINICKASQENENEQNISDNLINVSGPFLINQPTDKNMGDNDPETEDEDDCNNNRAYLQRKFNLLNQTKAIQSNQELQSLRLKESQSENRSIVSLNEEYFEGEIKNLDDDYKEMEERINKCINDIQIYQERLSKIDERNEASLKSNIRNQKEIKFEKPLINLQNTVTNIYNKGILNDSNSNQIPFSLTYNSQENQNNDNRTYRVSQQMNLPSDNSILYSDRRQTIKNIPAYLGNGKESKAHFEISPYQLFLYIGQENWNLVLKMMLVIRSAIKSLKKINHPGLIQSLYFNSPISKSILMPLGLSGMNDNGGLNDQSYNNSPIKLNHASEKSVVFNSPSALNMASSEILEIRGNDFLTHNQQPLFNSTSGTNGKLDGYEYIDYCPVVFESLRKMQAISPEQLLRSLGPESLIGNLIMGKMSHISELCRSSSEPLRKFQYYSECGQFIVKTIPEKYAMQLLHMLPHYYEYMKEQPESLLLRIYGLYKLQSPGEKSSRSKSKKFGKSSSSDEGNTNQLTSLKAKQSVYFIVCQNIFSTNLEIHKRFELKGSTRGRRAVKENKFSPNNTLPKKDLDWIDSKMRVYLDPQLKQRLIMQLQRDSRFLEVNRIINYSLLLGIHQFHSPEDAKTQLLNTINHSNQPYSANTGLSKIFSNDLKFIYFLGTINIFTEFSTSKKLISIIKNPFLGKTQSTVDPKTYASRFLSFFAQNVLG